MVESKLKAIVSMMVFPDGCCFVNEWLLNLKKKGNSGMINRHLQSAER